MPANRGAARWSWNWNSFGTYLPHRRPAETSLRCRFEYLFFNRTRVYYHGGPDGDYIAMRALGRTVAREVSVWFGEGIAEFYSTIQLRGRQMWVGDPVAPHIQMLGNRNMLDLKTLWAARYDSPAYREKSKPGLF